jgi:hypothetical protein
MISSGWSKRTPWYTYREEDEGGDRPFTQEEVRVGRPISAITG